MNLTQFRKVLEKFQLVAFTICGAGMVILLSVNGLSRYILNRGITWGDEITRLLFVWGCFIGITNAFIFDSHIGFDSLSKWKPWTHKMSKIANGIALILVGSVIVLYGSKFINQVGKFPLPASGLPIGLMYVAGILAGICWTIIGVIKIVQAFKPTRQSEEGELK